MIQNTISTARTMRVLLISANTERINILPLPLGLHCVAAATQQKGHNVKLVDLMIENDDRLVVPEAIESFHPDVIGISVRNIDDQKMENPRFLLSDVKKVVLECRNLSGALIILGGAGYSIFPESALNYLGADMGIQGEGEAVFPDVIDRIERRAELSGIPGLYLRGLGMQGERRFTKDLDLLPSSGARLFSEDRDREQWMPFQTRRGCPMNCTYCSTATIEGRTIRKRSPELVVEEITSLLDAGFQRFYFVDNTFNIPSHYAKEVCRKVIDRQLDLSWRCILYPGRIDEELIRLMASAGCKEASLGFESGSERILRNMNKKFGIDDIRETSHMLARYGIRQMGFLMLGGPGETKESVLESLSFADSLPLNEVKITLGIRIYPYTPLAKIALKEGKIMPTDDLLLPAFYMVADIEHWLRETVKVWMNKRPHWMM